MIKYMKCVYYWIKIKILKFIYIVLLENVKFSSVGVYSIILYMYIYQKSVVHGMRG